MDFGTEYLNLKIYSGTVARSYKVLLTCILNVQFKKLAYMLQLSNMTCMFLLLPCKCACGLVKAVAHATYIIPHTLLNGYL